MKFSGEILDPRGVKYAGNWGYENIKELHGSEGRVMLRGEL